MSRSLLAVVHRHRRSGPSNKSLHQLSYSEIEAVSWERTIREWLLPTLRFPKYVVAHATEKHVDLQVRINNILEKGCREWAMVAAAVREI